MHQRRKYTLFLQKFSVSYSFLLLITSSILELETLIFFKDWILCLTQGKYSRYMYVVVFESDLKKKLGQT